MKLKQPESILKSCVQFAKKTSQAKGAAQVLLADDFEGHLVAKFVKKHAHAWQIGPFFERAREFGHVAGPEGHVMVIHRRRPKGPFSHAGVLEESEYGWFRDQGGALWQALRANHVETAICHFEKIKADQFRGFLVGLELASYSYKNFLEKESSQEKANKEKKRDVSVGQGCPQLIFHLNGMSDDEAKRILAEAICIGEAVNRARHLVNLPPNILHPQSFEEIAHEEFGRLPGVQLDVWTGKKLISERMNLLLAVGDGARFGPRMIHLSYRPRKKSSARPIAFVGKGITFDSGGLDIKPSSGMRLMKKDMGGAAALMGLAWWAARSSYHRPLDFYFSLAENAIDSQSFRPSDVIQSRQGLRVEIHNTDAEGRLVLADALDVAATRKGADQPEAIIDVATLTGAIKTALGTEIAGLFSNHDPLADLLLEAGQQAGELSWRMPLYSRYTGGFSSPFADLVNAVDGWAGPITAALFLEKFVSRAPWAHFDIYAWADKPSGAVTSPGGNGQMVQTLIQYLSSLK